MLHPNVAELDVLPPDPERLETLRRNNHLAGHAGGETSQHGEEGILAAVLGRLGVARQGWCVEFGACDGIVHSNTRFLVRDRDWSAVYLERNTAMFRDLAALYAERAGVFTLHDAVGWGEEDGLDALLARTPIPPEFDLLVIDIDGNDYHVWEACRRHRPRVVMIEFNATVPPQVAYMTPPEVGDSASLRSLCELGRTKGYELVCVHGGNAVFVRRAYFDRFRIPDNRPEAMFRVESEMRLAQGYDGTLHLAGRTFMQWQWEDAADGVAKGLSIHPQDIQVLPVALQRLVPRMRYAHPDLDAASGTLDPEAVPGNRLLAHRHAVTSENGEDGILAEIFRRLGTGFKFCVEIGAADGRRFSNTHRLIAEQEWFSLQVEADDALFDRLRATHAGSTRVTCVQARATGLGENSLDVLLATHRAPPQPDLLVIDVEGNDYHLWKHLRVRPPRVVMVDFNPSAPNDLIMVQRDDAGVHVGSSLAAFVRLAGQKGYQLAAATEWNAIFVRNDLFPALDIADNRIDSMYRPLFVTRMFQTFNGRVCLDGCTRLIRHQVDFTADDLQVLPRALRDAGRWFHGFGRPKMFYGEPV